MSVKTPWPTHKAKARAHRKMKSAHKRRNRQKLELMRSGKRQGVIDNGGSI